MEYKGTKLPNYFSPKWANHSIYKGLRVIVFVRNMEREIRKLEKFFRKIEPLIFLVFKGVSEQIEIFVIW